MEIFHTTSGAKVCSIMKIVCCIYIFIFLIILLVINLPLCFRTIFNSELFQSTYIKIFFSLSFIMHEMFYIVQNFIFQDLHYKDLLLYYNAEFLNVVLLYIVLKLFLDVLNKKQFLKMTNRLKLYFTQRKLENTN